MRRANWIKISLIALLASVTVNIGAVRPASANAITTALSIVIDSSGSIGTTNFQTQKDAYAAVLGDATIVPVDGSVVVNIVQFSSAGDTQTVQSAIRLNSAADVTTVLNAIANNMDFLNGSTAIGEGIAQGRANMDAFLAGIDPSEFASNFKKIIDVSTDGEENQNSDPAGESQLAAAGGYAAINCLGIGASANCDFNDGPPIVGQDFAATDFDQLQPILAGKIQQEITGTPEPMTIGLLGIGLLGLGFAGRFLRKESLIA